MGTSTDYLGSPNWSSEKTETTRVAGQGPITPQKAESILSGFVDQMARAPQLGFGPPLSTQGSRSAAPTGEGDRGGGGSAGGGVGRRGGGGGGGGGGAHRIGGSTRSVARGIGGFLADVGAKGFREALAERGLTDLNGKSPDEIALTLADLLGGPASQIEQTALRGALMELVLEWSDGVQGVDGLVESVTNAAHNIEGALHDFFGHYIFEVFKTVGYQGVLATHGFEKAESMADQIRDFIEAKIGGLEASRALSSVDWNGADGALIVDGIIADTIAIFGEVQP
jgi:hypothetical protein